MQIEILRQYCLSLPAVTEDIKWVNNLCFSVAGKIFCIASLDIPYRFTFKVSDEEFDELSSRDGFIPAPYLAKSKWVTVIKTTVLSKKEFEKYLLESYELIKTKLSKKTKIDFGIV